eukprot:scaffold21448_cov63-Phaeocystis_antarctica.AAC.2
MYATQGSNPELADFARDDSSRRSATVLPKTSATHTFEPRLGQIHSLGRKAQSFYEGATLGVKMSTKNKRRGADCFPAESTPTVVLPAFICSSVNSRLFSVVHRGADERWQDDGRRAVTLILPGNSDPLYCIVMLST